MPGWGACEPRCRVTKSMWTWGNFVCKVKKIQRLLNIRGAHRRHRYLLRQGSRNPHILFGFAGPAVYSTAETSRTQVFDYNSLISGLQSKPGDPAIRAK